jgi:hypothetical protein
MWVKNLTIESTITSQQLNTLNTGLTNVVNHANDLQVAVNDVETLTATLWEWRPTADTRLTNLEANRITARNSTATTDPQFNVLSGTNVIPLVAGPGVRFETINRTIVGGLQAPDYIRVSAGPWVGGRLGAGGELMSSVGRYSFTISGRTGSADGMLISWNEPHLANLDFVKLVTPLPLVYGRARMLWNTWIHTNKSFRIFISDSSGAGLNTHFTFTVF